jgi:hypothetical protein
MLTPDLKQLLTQRFLGIPAWFWILGFYLVLDACAVYFAVVEPKPRTAQIHLPK